MEFRIQAFVIFAAISLMVPYGDIVAGVYDARIDEWEILTPKRALTPQINGPLLYGARANKPFIYRIPVSGERPIQFHIRGLPEGLKIDEVSGIITGRTPEIEGEFSMTFEVRNRHGVDRREWKLVIGDTLALTPMMGWNHWYTHYFLVTAEDIRVAAQAMVDSGLADVGYQYVSIDDCWMRISPENAKQAMDVEKRGSFSRTDLKAEAKVGSVRDGAGILLPADDFGDMKALADDIHRLGLKAGIYSSPGPRTCELFEGSWAHEGVDARAFAEWGFDLLKYDWCRYGEVFDKLPKEAQTIEARKEPFLKMYSLLQAEDRDIVFNLCEYGLGNVWTWGKEAGHSWRVGGDLGNTLTSGGIYDIARKNITLRDYNGPGGWNDPDYLILGKWRLAEDKSGSLVPVELSANEQYSYFSLWCLMACPLFFSGDMVALDDFTYGILCNTELIAVNQDPAGRCAEPVGMAEDEWIWKKALADGSVVVGFFNLSKEEDRILSVAWGDLGFCCPQSGRDLWRQKNLGIVSEEFSVKVGPRGCAVIQFRPKF